MLVPLADGFRPRSLQNQLGRLCLTYSNMENDKHNADRIRPLPKSQVSHSFEQHHAGEND